jgi:DeoR family fructose operon transcriptional repressor
MGTGLRRPMFDYVGSHMAEHASQRREAMAALLSEGGTINVAALAVKFAVSEMTVRRDLDALVAAGVAARVHGGAVPTQSLRFTSRLARHQREKKAAALKLAPHLPARGTIYLDGSTTIYHLTALLANRPGLVVVSNNIDTFRAVQGLAGITAILVGGTLNVDTDNFVGPFARRQVEGMAFTAAFFGSFQLDAVAGPSEPSAEDAEIKHLVASRTQHVLLAVNHHKLGAATGTVWTAPVERSLLATDLPPADRRLDPLRTRFATII